MPRILSAIQQQNMELVRDRIAEILIDELVYQGLISPNESLTGLQLEIERAAPVNHSEMPFINVMVARGDFDNQHIGHTDGTYTYVIDCYQKAKTSSIQRGDERVAVKLQRMMGMVRAILENPQYKTLGFVPPSIGNRQITNMEFRDPPQTDAVSTMMGRITFRVKVNETSSLLDAELIGGYDTVVKMGESEQGYRWSLENTLAAPRNITSEVVGDDIELTWEDINDNPGGFRILRSTSYEGPFEEVGEVYADALSWQDTDVDVDVIYYYIIQVFDDVSTADSEVYATYRSSSEASINITVNAAAFTTGATADQDIEVEDSEGTLRGSKVGSRWRIANGVITLLTHLGNTIGSISAVAGKTYNSALGAITLTIRNSALTTVSSGSEEAGINIIKTLSDITLTINNQLGGAISSSSEVAGVAITKAITLYASRDQWKSGAVTSYCDGDDAFLQEGAGASFTTLEANRLNVFATPEKFTDELGGSTYTKDIVIDHSTFDPLSGTYGGARAYYRVLYSSVTMEISAGTTSAITACKGTSITGFTSEWEMANISMVNSLIDGEYIGTANGLNYAPFNHAINNGANNVWTNTFRDSGTRAVAFSTNSIPVLNLLTTSSKAMATRWVYWNPATQEFQATAP